MKKENIIVSIILICIGLFAIYETTNFKENPYGLTQDNLGPAFFPIVVSILIILLCILLIVSEFRKNIKKESVSIFNTRMIFPMIVVVIVLSYAFLMEHFGYIISTIILNILLLIIFKIKKVTLVIAFPVLVTLIIYAIFKIVFKVPLAYGIFF